MLSLALQAVRSSSAFLLDCKPWEDGALFCSLKSLQSLAQHLAFNRPQDVFLGRLAGDRAGIIGHREGVWFIPHSSLSHQRDLSRVLGISFLL